MLLLDLEHNTRIEELEEEIDDIRDEALQTMKTSEKVCNGYCVCGQHTNEHTARNSIMPHEKSKQDYFKLFYDLFTIATSENLAWGICGEILAKSFFKGIKNASLH